MKRIKLNQEQSLERMEALQLQDEVAERMEALDLNYVFLWGKQYAKKHSLGGKYICEDAELDTFIESLEVFIKELKESK